MRQTESSSFHSWLSSPPLKKESRHMRLTVVFLVPLERIADSIEGVRVDLPSSCLMNLIIFGCLLVMATSAALASTLSFTNHSSPSLNFFVLSIILTHHFWDTNFTITCSISSCSAFSANICSIKETTDSSAVFCFAFWNETDKTFLTINLKLLGSKWITLLDFLPPKLIVLMIAMIWGPRWAIAGGGWDRKGCGDALRGQPSLRWACWWTTG